MRVAQVVIGVLIAVPWGCSRPQPSRPAQGTVAWRVWMARLAAPMALRAAARVVDRPASGDAPLAEIAPGSNGWTCMPDDSTTPGLDPVCMDSVYLTWYLAYRAHRVPAISSVGLAYSLLGASIASGSDPFRGVPDEGRDWTIIGPHVAAVMPDPRALRGLSTDMTTGEPFVLWSGTPYARLVAPVGLLAEQPESTTAVPAGPARGTTEWKIQNAMSAAPAAIAKAATILDFPGTDGKTPQLRAGTNGWSCLPDDPQTPGNDPVCWDQASGVWHAAWMHHKTPHLTKPGLSYMLRGATNASNTDPYKAKPDSGQGWTVTGPDIMIVPSDVRTLAGRPTDWKSGAPYVRWAGTPYAHLVVPVAAPKPASADSA